MGTKKDCGTSPLMIWLPHIKKQSLSVRTTDLSVLLVCEHHLLHVSIWSFHQQLCDYCFSLKLFLTAQRVFSSSLSPLPSLPSCVHPSVHPSGRGEERRTERSAGWSEGWSDSWSPVRQGETNYPSNENHSSSLHLSSLPSSTPPSEIQRTWMATPGKKKKEKSQLYSPCCSHSVVTHAAPAISTLFY